MRRIGIGDFPIGKNERAAIERVLDSGRITEHRETRAFENEFADWLGVEYCVAVSSGTAALMCGLMALKYDDRFPRVRDGCRVLVPALTFIATANAVTLCGMEPVFGDVLLQTFGLDPHYVDPSQAVIVPVHLFGCPASFDEIKAATTLDTIVVEDACEAHGSSYRGQKCGTLGLWSAFSFYIAHTVQAGELGVVCTDDEQIANAVRRIKAHGRQCACKVCARSQGKCPHLSNYDPRYHHLTPGYNFKPMEFQAALARLQLTRIDENIEKRRENVFLLNRLLANATDELALPVNDDTVARMAYPLILWQGSETRRHAMLRYLEANGVEARPLFGCIPTQQPAYVHLKEQYKDKLPVAEFYGSEGFFIGCHQYLTKDDIAKAASAILEALRETK